MNTAFCVVMVFCAYSQIHKCNVGEQEKLLMLNKQFAAKADSLELVSKNWIVHNFEVINRTNCHFTIVVHIVYNSSEENISDEQILSQIDVLNQDFQGLNEEYNNDPAFSFNQGNPQFEFSLATVDPSGMPSTGITRTFTPEVNIGEKKDVNGRTYIKHGNLGGVDAWPSDEYINIWVGSRASTFGEGTRPGLSLEGEDGIVIDPDYFGTKGTAEANIPFHLGRVCTHEMGHFFNLIHPWGLEQSCFEDDQVEDTPAQKSPFYGCPEANYQCGEKEMVHNFMDYVDDDCMFYFSKGQVNRMWASVEGPRKSLVSNFENKPNPLFPAERPYWLRYISGLQELQIYLSNDFILNEINVYSVDGRLLLNQEGQYRNFLKIDAREWETGPYIVCLHAGKNRWTEKLIKY